MQTLGVVCLWGFLLALVMLAVIGLHYSFLYCISFTSFSFLELSYTLKDCSPSGSESYFYGLLLFSPVPFFLILLHAFVLFEWKRVFRIPIFVGGFIACTGAMALQYTKLTIWKNSSINANVPLAILYVALILLVSGVVFRADRSLKKLTLTYFGTNLLNQAIAIGFVFGVAPVYLLELTEDWKVFVRVSVLFFFFHDVI
jgi:hypothetical protein